MRILIWGDLSNPHISKMCQWLADKDIDVLPTDTMNSAVLTYKAAKFAPDIIQAFGIYQALTSEISFGHILTAEGAPKCVDTNRFAPGYSPFFNRFHETLKTRAILIPNHIDPEYNIDTIVKAFSIVLKDRPDTNLVFHNPGDNLPYQETISKLCEDVGVAERVFSNAYVQYVRMPQIYNAVDVVVVVPTIEMSNCTILEAMACETPVVASKNVRNEKLLPNNWLVDVRDYETMADRIMDATMGLEPSVLADGREKIEMLYEQDTWMEMMMEKYETEIAQ